MSLAHRFPANTAIGRALRWPLRLVPAALTVPILRGPARGMRWTVGASSHSCWLGTYEPETQRTMARLIRPGATVYDIGANCGYYTLLAAKRVGARGHVVAVEPDPENVSALRAHVARNRLNRVTVLAAAAADTDGVATFARGATSATGRLAEKGITVPVVRLDTMCEEGRIPPPDVCKIDVEGAAGRVLAGMSAIIAAHSPAFVIAMHDGAEFDACYGMLHPAGYDIADRDGTLLCLPHGAPHGSSGNKNFA